MLRICLALMMIFMVRQPVLAQSATQMSEDLSQASLIQEQAAICAAFARVMEYSGLLEETRGKLWRERRFYAGAILRQVLPTIGARAIERCHRRDHQPIFRLDDQSFLCHASRIQENRYRRT